MVGVSAAPSRSWSHGRAIDHLRCLPRPHGERGRVPARGAMAALHGAFLSERLQPRADDQGPRGDPTAPADASAGSFPRFVRRLHSYYDEVRLLVSVHHRLRLLTFPMRTVPLTQH